jgi:hypothetical protein
MVRLMQGSNGALALGKNGPGGRSRQAVVPIITCKASGIT